MNQILPANAKVSKEAKEITMQECVSEFINFVASVKKEKKEEEEKEEEEEKNEKKEKKQKQMKKKQKKKKKQMKLKKKKKKKKRRRRRRRRRSWPGSMGIGPPQAVQWVAAAQGCSLHPPLSKTVKGLDLV
ncbi:Nuclear transcription factor Y subunit B-5 [Morella rubra]|uniref:Nuclear transcription factor Y subunit B-5 n=1 Tax=Morella rubra TaxID=262757 RepID=A0A6A1VMB9_9ROSI|nr:Nuclear transcription factor Y subunit B-5 [Morella rubra]